jgi:hypothetical protein
LEVTVHNAYEKYPMSQTNRCGSYPTGSSDAQLAFGSPQELGLDDNIQGRDEKK